MKSAFTALNLSHTDSNEWTLMQDFRFFGEHNVWVVPGGFKTDLDSVPRVPLVYALFKGRATKAAVLHDWMYTTKKGKFLADKTFLEAMKAEGVKFVHRFAIYLAVTLFGWSIYQSK
jgi:hypothetical protein